MTSCDEERNFLMEQSHLQAVWEQVLHTAQAHGKITEVAYRKWLQPVEPISWNGNLLVLGAPNDFSCNWIKERYITALEEAVYDAMGEHCTIEMKNLNKPQKEASFPPMPAHGKRERQKSRHAISEDIPMQTTLLDNSNGLQENLPSAMDNIASEEFRITPDEISHAQSIHEPSEQIAPGDASSLNPKYTFDTFVTGNSNQFAHAAALAVADSPGRVYNPFFMYGGVGLGKTHLMHAIAHQILQKNPDKRVLYVSSEKFTNELINGIRDGNVEFFRQKYRTIDVLLVDDVQFLSGKAGTQEEFFHTFNTLHDSGRAIILSSDRPPHEVKQIEERLISRFEGGLVTEVQTPDFETRIAILKKKAQLDRLNVPNEVMVSIASSIVSNIRELEGALTRVVAYASLMHQPITVAIAEETLKNLFANNKKREITIEFIENIVADYFQLRVEDLHTKKRTREIAYPRQIAMFLCRELTDTSLPQIGNFFGGRDHTTVIHAYDKIKKEKETDAKLSSILQELVSRIQNH